jgi:macrodomain Ter protein organizer (MatP/YcbG family)
MEIKIVIRTIVVKDKSSGEEYTVKTVRSAKDIAAYIEESENDEAVDALQAAVTEAY